MSAIRVDLSYVDVTGDLVAAILLSQLVYWFSPGANGVSKLRVRREGRAVLAKKRVDWWSECRLTPRQYDRAIEILEKLSVVEVSLHRFDGTPTPHIWLNQQHLAKLVAEKTASESTE